MALNAMYAGYDDGTATWSEALAAALPEANVIRSSFDPTRRTRAAFLRKILYELVFRYRVHEDLRLHPYTACALDPKAALVVLDTLGAVLGTSWLSHLARRSIERATWLATISRQEQSTLEAHFGRNFAVLTPFPSHEFFVRPVRASGLNPGTKVLRVAYWGGWHPRKGMVELLRTVPVSCSVQFYCTGDPPSELAARPDVTLVGKLSRTALIDLIDGSHAALYPSTAEGFGLPPYEALLRGRPVIVRPLPCYQDYLSNLAGPGVWPLASEGDFCKLLDSVRRAGTVEPSVHLQTPDYASAVTRLRTQAVSWLPA